MVADDWKTASSFKLSNKFSDIPQPSKSAWSLNYDINAPYITTLLLGQGALLFSALFFGFITGVDVTNFGNISFDEKSMYLAMSLGSLMYIGAAVMDRLPYPFFRRV